MAIRRSPSDTVVKRVSTKRKNVVMNVQSASFAIEQEVPPQADADAVHARIAARAYALYEAGGYRHGWDLQDWLEAERRLMEEGNA